MSSVTVLEQIPGYRAMNYGEDVIAVDFAKDVHAVRSADDIRKLVIKWRALWELTTKGKPEHVQNIDTRIVAGDFDADEAFECFKRVAQGQTCRHATPWGLKKRPRKKRLLKKMVKSGSGSLCPGMEIRLPWSMFTVAMVSHHYGVPETMALHQAFCDGPHDGCF